jgi:hypothetical protein
VHHGHDPKPYNRKLSYRNGSTLFPQNWQEKQKATVESNAKHINNVSLENQKQPNRDWHNELHRGGKKCGSAMREGSSVVNA